MSKVVLKLFVRQGTGRTQNMLSRSIKTFFFNL